MKKIIISISIIISVIVCAIVCVFFFTNRKTEIKIESMDWEYSTVLGEYNISNYEYNNFINTITFEVDSAKDFYNEFLKTNSGFKKDLDFDIEGYFAYGFLILDDHIIKYKVYNNNHVEISECLNDWTIKDEEINDYYKGEQNLYYIPGPMNINISYDRLNKELSDNKFDSVNTYKSLSDDFITFDMLVAIYSYLPSEIYKIEGNSIYLKGYRHSIQKREGEKYFFEDTGKFYSNVYLIKISLIDDRIVVSNADK